MGEELSQDGSRWRTLAQALIGVLLSMILAGMAMIWNRLDRIDQHLVEVTTHQATDIAKGDSAITDFNRRLDELSRRISTLEDAVHGAVKGRLYGRP